jgi:hypothetical protein
VSEPINDGGPAFPKTGHPHDQIQDGMSLRQWFAGIAMQGILASTQGLTGTGFGSEAMKKLVAKAFMLADLALSMDADEKQTDPQQDGP